MKNLFIFFALTLIEISLAQGRFSGYVVTNENDTIKCSFSLYMNIFDKSLFYDATLSKKVKIFKENGEKAKYIPSELKTIFITGPKQGNYKFVSLEQDKKHFFHEITIGKLSYYVIYRENIQGGFPLEVPCFVKEGKLTIFNGFFVDKKDEFSKLISDFPELQEKWTNAQDSYYVDSKFPQYIKLYNDHFVK